MKTTLCLLPEDVVESLFIADAIECVYNVGHRFSTDPVHSTVVNICYLQQSLGSGPFPFTLTPEDLSHPPIIVNVFSSVRLTSDDHNVSRADR